VAAGCVLAACPLTFGAARADHIILTNGRVIEADRTWYDGAQLRYEKDGGAYGLPRSLVKSVESDAPPGAPPSGAAPVPPSRLATPPPRRMAAAQFRIRYDGGINEPLGLAVLDALSQAYKEYARRLGFAPEDPVTVVLQMGTAFQEGGAPEWAAGTNDGTIRVPVHGLDGPSPQLLRVLRHELAHSFIAARTVGNCPTWLQEGIAQWLEGGDPARQDAIVAAAASTGRLLPLLTLEAPFQSLPATEVPLAYAESLSAVAHIIRIRGEVGVGRLLAGLGDRLPSEEALPVALALSYPEFQKSWEAQLRRPTGPARRSEGAGAR
jgi:peptidase MA superfamily protein